MKRSILFIILSGMAFLGFAQDNHPVSWKFTSERIAPLTYKVNFIATIQAPYHIYPQTEGGMGMPTEFLFADNDNIELIGKVTEKGVVKQEGEEVAYYKQGVTFTQTVKLKSETKTDLVLVIRYMACNDLMCLPPSKKQFTVAVNDASGSAAAENSNSNLATNDAKAPFTYSDFEMADINGKKVSTKEITTKSKYTFIDFWASWCVPCRAQGRELIPVYNKYKAKGFEVIAVSLDTRPDLWKKAIEADKYTWTNISDLKGFESEISKRFHIVAIPRNFLIDQQGNIVAKDLHGKELEAKLADLFK
ncbi:MAG: peroxiredoxin family protein [Pseudobacter sp.]|uniref:peroxiredoxin family protein n=1 Tax=Pseudobacter sp. TaxID=2045420 RepID=UPI003F7DE67E